MCHDVPRLAQTFFQSLRHPLALVKSVVVARPLYCARTPVARRNKPVQRAALFMLRLAQALQRGLQQDEGYHHSGSRLHPVGQSRRAGVNARR